MQYRDVYAIILLVSEKQIDLKVPEIEKEAHFNGGQIGYSVLEGNPGHSPIVIVPGFTEGRFVLRDLSKALNQHGHRTVVFPDQPELDSSKQPILDQHAEALLAIIQSEGIADTPTDFIAHSFGALTLARAAELAKERGMPVFDEDGGSSTIIIAPAGVNPNENIAYHAGRWFKFMSSQTYYKKEIDPTGDFMKAGVKNATKQPGKTLREIARLIKKGELIQRMAKVGLQPYVVTYASDNLYPDKNSAEFIDNNLDSLEGWSTPIDNGGIGAGSFEEFKTKSGLSAKAAKKAWVHHYRNSNHNDFIFHPDRTAKAVLQILGS